MTESRRIRGRKLNEADDRYSDFGDEFGGELRKGSRMPTGGEGDGGSGGSGGIAKSSIVADPVVEKGDFKTCLLECVDIVKNHLYMANE